MPTGAATPSSVDPLNPASSSSSQSPPSPETDTPPFRKRALSNSSITSSASNKRALSVDPSLSDAEGSLGASRLNIVDNDSSSSSPLQPQLDDAQSFFSDRAPPPDYEEASITPPVPSTTMTFHYVAPTESSPPPPTVQWEIVKDLRNMQPRLEKGDKWYLVSRQWFRKWQSYASGVAESKEDADITEEDVGAIDNRDISDEKGNMLPALRDGVQLEMLPPQVWSLLLSWYGLHGPTFERQVVAGEAHGSERVEFYPPLFHIYLLLPQESTPGSTVAVPVLPSPPVLSLSSGASVASLLSFAREAFNLEKKPIRLWRLPGEDDDIAGGKDGAAFVFTDKLNEDGVELIIRDNITANSTLAEALLDSQVNRLAVEEALDEAGETWLVDPSTFNKTIKVIAPSPASTSEPTGLFGANKWTDAFNRSKTNTLTPKYGSKEGGSDASTSTKGKGLFGGIVTRAKSVTRGQRGLTGLQNLGNTCFMNSALQCMSNTKELQEYFMSGVYKNELNPDNPLGMGGQVAEVFGQLIERLWSSSSGSYAPREFKQTLSRFAPSFSGYGQQDSQEFLAFLLDGIHEDLNRIKKKPATNAPDWMGGGDKELVELAKTCWEQYRSRNDSVIVDLFQGQYRSTVVCPDCDKVSITFDPFMYVTTNLPVTKKWTGTVYYVPLDDKKPRYSVEVELPKNGTVKSIKIALGKFFNCEAKNLIVVEIWKARFYKEWHDDDELSEVSDSDQLIFYEAAYPCAQPKPRFYGKSKPLPPPANLPAIIPVLQSTAKKTKPMRGFNARASDVDHFGHPFLLSLSPEEASSIEGIYTALAKQYARATKLGEELIEAVQGVIEAEAAYAELHPPAPADVAVPAVLSTPSAPTVPLPLTPPPEDDAPMDVDEPAVSNDVPSASSSESISASESPAVVTPSIDPSLEDGPPPTSLFRVTIITSNKATLSFPTNDLDTNAKHVSLQERAAEIAAKAAPNSSATSDGDAEVDMAAEASSDLMQPLLRMGETLLVEWEPAPLAHFFGGDGTKGPNALWETLTKFVDPAIAESKAREKGAKKVITIEDCLNEFTREERLGEDDTWYCPVCKKHQRATKKVELWKVPDVLVFALKRFSSSRYSRDKIGDFVDFPIENFNMEPYVEGDKVERRLAHELGTKPADPEPLIYDLYAVDNHYGGLGGGHYTAYAKNPESGKWSDYDDSRVSEIKDPESRVKTNAAYLLFYRRRTTRPIGAKSRELVQSAIQSRNHSAANSEAGPSRPESPAPSMDDTHSSGLYDTSLHSWGGSDPQLPGGWHATSSVRPLPSPTGSIDSMNMNAGSSPSHSPVLAPDWADDTMEDKTVELRLEELEGPSELETLD